MRPIVRDHVILDPIHVGQPRLPVLGVALQLDGRTVHVLFQLERPAAHSILSVPMLVLIEIFLGIDEVRRVGQIGQERREGWCRWKTTVDGSGASMLLTIGYSLRRGLTTPSDGKTMRSQLALTSADVRSLSSWNLTPGAA